MGADQADAERFMARFTKAWGTRDPHAFVDAFTPDGTVYHPTMTAAKTSAEMVDYFTRLFAVAPDVELAVTHWAHARGVVLVEWRMEASYGARRVAWMGADRFTLRGDRAVEGVAYFDTMHLWRLLDERLAALPSVEAALAAPA